jgi:hypothetical protein
MWVFRRANKRGLLTLLGAPVPGPQQSDTTLFFGLGGGLDLNLSRPLGLRVAAEYAPVLQSADEPAKLCAVLRWPDLPLGPFEVARHLHRKGEDVAVIAE